MKLSIFLLVVFSVTVLCVDYEHVKKFKNQRIIEPDTKMSSVSSSRSAQESDNKRVEKFKKQHIIEPVTEESCDELIRERNITRKPENTFIFSTFEEVKVICTEEQRVPDEDGGNIYRSSKKMEILYCKLHGEKKTYKGKMKKEHIKIACVKIDGVLQPVHFEP